MEEVVTNERRSCGSWMFVGAKDRLQCCSVLKFQCEIDDGLVNGDSVDFGMVWRGTSGKLLSPGAFLSVFVVVWRYGMPAVRGCGTGTGTGTGGHSF
jgi:hypothetical protein